MSRLVLTEPQSRDAMLREWVRRRLGAVEHELRVARVGRMLFGATRRWHGSGCHFCSLFSSERMSAASTRSPSATSLSVLSSSAGCPNFNR